MVVNHTHARCMEWRWARYSLSLVSMFLPLAKCFLLLRAELPVASCCSPHLSLKWKLASCNYTKTKMFCFTEDYGEAFTGSNEGRLCENMWSSSLQFLWDIWSKEVYGEASRTFIIKVRLEHATLKTRKKLFLSHLKFFLFLCHACSLSSVQGFKNLPPGLPALGMVLKGTPD